MDDETTNCAKCGSEISTLAVFPGGICVGCYEQTPAANAPLTADGLADMFRGVVAAPEKPFCGCDAPKFCDCDSSRYQTARGK